MMTQATPMTQLHLNDQLSLFNQAWRIVAIADGNPRSFTLERPNGKRYNLTEDASKSLPRIID